MPHFTYSNVNTAFRGLVQGFEDGSIPTIRGPSRVGSVMTVVEPVIVTYENPCQRVLFNQQRDANCFLHLYESLWMLAGRNDIAPLEYYAADFGKFVRDKDDPDHQTGSYGYRWRHAKAGREPYHYDSGNDMTPRPVLGSRDKVVDQLAVIIDQLRRKPESRRVVLSMWNVEQDLLKIDTSVDVCCNLCCTFMIRTELSDHPDAGQTVSPYVKFLDMTVFNRSNDLIFGTLGANVVHFSFLLEYIANCLRVNVGRYNQVSSNLHAYTERWYADKWLAGNKSQLLCEEHHPDGMFKGIDYITRGQPCAVCGDNRVFVKEHFPKQEEYRSLWEHVPLVKDQARFDEENDITVDGMWGPNVKERYGDWLDRPLSEPFLQTVAMPMLSAFYWHKQRDYTLALDWCFKIAATDWRIAATNWITKRKTNWEKKGAVANEAD